MQTIMQYKLKSIQEDLCKINSYAYKNKKWVTNNTLGLMTK